MAEVDAVMAQIRNSFREEECPPMDEARIFGPSETQAAFRSIGLTSIDQLIRYAQLERDEQVLDIGCGIGRVALPLTHYLNSSGGYRGIDPVEGAVAWCRENISSQYPSFRFDHVDFHNAMYNPRGSVDPRNYEFPYEGGSFDLIFLFSVFTHMQPDSVSQYLTEIKRLMSPQGRALVSMFLVDDHARAQFRAGQAHRPFFRAQRWAPASRAYWTDNADLHESAIAYPVKHLDRLLDHAGLTYARDVVFGGWRDRKPGQDTVVLKHA